jgi:DUF4097 and DUF4098 domain-containing protein YvlB
LGLRLQSSNGNLNLENIQAQSTFFKTSHGNIEIGSGPEYYPSAVSPEVQEESMTISSEGTTAETSAVNTVPVKENTLVDTNTPLGILKALKDGKISVDEADRLLRAMEV